ncbi:SUMF1/EgtB/PvdO family nonheme iron enzyme, partial [Tamlana crocina]|nr:formylglycine-generating enzyme family protein [Tamlana crocina]
MIYTFLILALFILGCREKEPEIAVVHDKPEEIKTPEGMVWIPGGEFSMGAVENDQMALDHEKPAHPVAVDGFFMDVTEVTNREFREFVEETGYVTV